jgi:hypothetical protein
MEPGGTLIFGVDSVIVTSLNTGQWTFYANEIGTKNFYVYIINDPPVEPICMATDTSFCTATFSLQLDAENQNPGGHAADYLWDNGSTNRLRTVTTPGTYTVTVTNACGVGVYDIVISQSNPNGPDLGPDQAFCWGSSTVLDPLSTNVSSYLWSTGATTPTITVDTTGSYWVYLVDNNGCSGRDTVQITSLLPIDGEICYVEFDTITWYNDVNWTSNLPENADSVKVYKETSLGVWDLLGTVGNLDTNFIDMGSNPQAQSYSYKIGIVDTCGNESEMSQHHTTITLLSAYDSGTNTYGFTWSAYQGLIVSDYYLFGIDAGNNVTQIATVPANVYMYNYVNPSASYIKYFVGFETPDCNGSKANVIVKSNWVQSVITGVVFTENFDFAFFPNPVSDKFEIRTSLNDYAVELINVFGQVLYSGENVKEINVSEFAPGTYILQINGDNFTRQERIIVY